MSSPNINNLILAGCLLVYCTIGMEDINAEGLRVLCYVSGGYAFDQSINLCSSFFFFIHSVICLWNLSLLKVPNGIKDLKAFQNSCVRERLCVCARAF